ncbi:MAG TPA: class I SAM-dependent methyltransferase [Bacteroidota bacterium]|nr:class I SAM-dependent methyltransferase [Bacteroidota bacterium]
MMADTDNETLKQEVRDYWNAHPCGTQFTDLQPGSREFFDEVERYRFEIQPFMRDIVRFDQYAGKKVLEVGCGLGTDLIQFARAGAEVTGIDLTPQSIDFVRKRFRLEGLPLRADVADAEHLPFDDDSFDVVYSFGVLHHTPNTQRAVREVYRVLKPGGEAVVMLYHKNSFHVRVGTPLFSMFRAWNGRFRRATASVDDWVRIYDGGDNPLGKAYTKSEAARLFAAFRNVTFELRDPIRRRFPEFLNSFNQHVLAPFSGFYLFIRGEK